MIIQLKFEGKMQICANYLTFAPNRCAVIWWQRGQKSDLIDVGLILDKFIL